MTTMLPGQKTAWRACDTESNHYGMYTNAVIWGQDWKYHRSSKMDGHKCRTPLAEVAAIDSYNYSYYCFVASSSVVAPVSERKKAYFDEFVGKSRNLSIAGSQVCGVRRVLTLPGCVMIFSQECKTSRKPFFCTKLVRNTMDLLTRRINVKDSPLKIIPSKGSIMRQYVNDSSYLVLLKVSCWARSIWSTKQPELRYK